MNSALELSTSSRKAMAEKLTFEREKALREKSEEYEKAVREMGIEAKAQQNAMKEGLEAQQKAMEYEMTLKVEAAQTAKLSHKWQSKARMSNAKREIQISLELRKAHALEEATVEHRDEILRIQSEMDTAVRNLEEQLDKTDDELTETKHKREELEKNSSSVITSISGKVQDLEAKASGLQTELDQALTKIASLTTSKISLVAELGDTKSKLVEVLYLTPALTPSLKHSNIVCISGRKTDPRREQNSTLTSPGSTRTGTDV